MALPKVNTPTYELTLPSTGERVAYRPYLVKEEKIIMLAAESTDEKQMVRAVKDVIASCTNGDIDTNKITMFDLEYLFTQLRAKSVGESSDIKVKCAECEKNNDVSVNLGDITVNVPEESHKGTVKKITEDISVLLQYPIVDTVLESYQGKSEIDTAFDLIASCIDTIYQGDEAFDVSEASKDEVIEFVESLSTHQFQDIYEFVDTMPSACLDVQFKCVHCGHDNDITIKGLVNFFS